MFATIVLSVALAYGPDGLAIGDGSVEVLDISLSRGWVALRVLTHSNGDSNRAILPSIDCKYPGMKATPAHGVQILLWDLKKQALAQTFTIYEDAVHTDDCSDQQVAEAELAKAKAAVAQKGLVITRKPKGLNGDALTFDVVKRGAAEEETLVGTVKVGGKTVSTFEAPSNAEYGFGSLTLENTFTEGTKIVALLSYKFDATTLRGTTFFFTPILTLPGPKK